MYNARKCTQCKQTWEKEDLRWGKTGRERQIENAIKCTKPFVSHALNLHCDVRWKGCYAHTHTKTCKVAAKTENLKLKRKIRLREREMARERERGRWKQEYKERMKEKTET